MHHIPGHHYTPAAGRPSPQARHHEGLDTRKQHADQRNTGDGGARYHIEKRVGLHHVPWLPVAKPKPARAKSPEPHWLPAPKSDASHPNHPTGEFKSYDNHEHGDHDHKLPHHHPDAEHVVTFDLRTHRPIHKKVRMPNKTPQQRITEMASRNALERRATRAEEERAADAKALREEWVRKAVQRMRYGKCAEGWQHWRQGVVDVKNELDRRSRARREREFEATPPHAS